MNKKVVGLAVALVLLISACGTGTASEGRGGSASPTSQPLPGVQAFGLTNEEFASYVEQVESKIAECMAEAGFEYVPADVTGVLEVGVWMRADPSLSREDFKTRWGFGVSTRTDDPAREIGLGDQNVRIYENLSESEKVAYDRTLFGDDPDATFAMTLDDEDFSGTGGCTKEAVTEVFPAEMLSSSYINPKDVLIESDPRVVAAEEEWMDAWLRTATSTRTRTRSSRSTRSDTTSCSMVGIPKSSPEPTWRPWKSFKLKRSQWR